MRRPVAALIALITLAACADADDAPVAEAEPDAPAATATADPDSACVHFTERALTFDPVDAGAVRASLGEPDSLRARGVGVGAHTDSTATWFYPGLTVSSHKAAGGTAVVDEVRVTDGRWLRSDDVALGMSEAALRSALGSPADTPEGDLVYACHSHPANDNPVRLRMRDGALMEVIFTYYMD